MYTSKNIFSLLLILATLTLVPAQSLRYSKAKVRYGNDSWLSCEAWKLWLSKKPEHSSCTIRYFSKEDRLFKWSDSPTTYARPVTRSEQLVSTQPTYSLYTINSALAVAATVVGAYALIYWIITPYEDDNLSKEQPL